MVNYNYKFFIELINSFISNEPVKPKYDVEWDEIIRLAKINNLLGILFISIEKMDKSNRPKEELYNKLKEIFYFKLEIVTK